MSSSPEDRAPPAELAERRFRSVNGVALIAFGLGPLFGGLAGGLLYLGGALRAPECVAVGVLLVALTWGFLGSISWLTARGIEATETAVESRRLLKTARSDPGAGQLALGDGDSGALSRPGPSRSSSSSPKG